MHECSNSYNLNLNSLIFINSINIFVSLYENKHHYNRVGVNSARAEKIAPKNFARGDIFARADNFAQDFFARRVIFARVTILYGFNLFCLIN